MAQPGWWKLSGCAGPCLEVPIQVAIVNDLDYPLPLLMLLLPFLPLSPGLLPSPLLLLLVGWDVALVNLGRVLY